ncbi:25094_t:CDS:2, partial [Cetraspora pellucida]
MASSNTSDIQVGFDESQLEMSVIENQNTLPTHDKELKEVEKLDEDDPSVTNLTAHRIADNTEQSSIDSSKNDSSILQEMTLDEDKPIIVAESITDSSSSIIVHRTTDTGSKHSTSANSPTVPSMTVSSESSKLSRSGSGTQKKTPPPIKPKPAEAIEKWKLKRIHLSTPVKDDALQKSNSAEAKKTLQKPSHIEKDDPETKKSLFEGSSHIKEDVTDSTLQDLNGSDTKKTILQGSSNIEDAKDSFLQELDDPRAQEAVLQGSSLIKKEVLHEPDGSETKKTAQDPSPTNEEVKYDVFQESETQQTIFQDSSPAIEKFKYGVLQESDDSETRKSLQDSSPIILTGNTENYLPKQTSDASKDLISNQSGVKVTYPSHTELEDKVLPDSSQETNNPDSQKRKQGDSYQTNSNQIWSFEEINKHLTKEGAFDNDASNEAQQSATSNDAQQSATSNDTQQSAASKDTQHPAANEIMSLYEIKKHLDEKGIGTDSPFSSGVPPRPIIEAENNIQLPNQTTVYTPNYQFNIGPDNNQYNVETNKNTPPFTSNPVAVSPSISTPQFNQFNVETNKSIPPFTSNPVIISPTPQFNQPFTSNPVAVPPNINTPHFSIGADNKIKNPVTTSAGVGTSTYQYNVETNRHITSFANNPAAVSPKISTPQSSIGPDDKINNPVTTGIPIYQQYNVETNKNIPPYTSSPAIPPKISTPQSSIGPDDKINNPVTTGIPTYQQYNVETNKNIQPYTSSPAIPPKISTPQSSIGPDDKINNPVTTGIPIYQQYNVETNENIPPYKSSPAISPKISTPQSSIGPDDKINNPVTTGIHTYQQYNAETNKNFPPYTSSPVIPPKISTPQSSIGPDDNINNPVTTGIHTYQQYNVGANRNNPPYVNKPQPSIGVDNENSNSVTTSAGVYPSTYQSNVGTNRNNPPYVSKPQPSIGAANENSNSVTTSNPSTYLSNVGTNRNNPPYTSKPQPSIGVDNENSNSVTTSAGVGASTYQINVEANKYIPSFVTNPVAVSPSTPQSSFGADNEINRPVMTSSEVKQSIYQFDPSTTHSIGAANEINNSVTTSTVVDTSTYKLHDENKNTPSFTTESPLITPAEVDTPTNQYDVKNIQSRISTPHNIVTDSEINPSQKIDPKTYRTDPSEFRVDSTTFQQSERIYPNLQIDDEQNTSNYNSLLDFNAPSPIKELSDDNNTTNIPNESDDAASDYVPASEYIDIRDLKDLDSTSEYIDVKNLGGSTYDDASLPIPNVLSTGVKENEGSTSGGPTPISSHHGIGTLDHPLSTEKVQSGNNRQTTLNFEDADAIDYHLQLSDRYQSKEKSGVISTLKNVGQAAASLLFGKDEDKYAYGESVLVTFHVHLPPGIERHGEPVIVGNCEELGGWKMITIKLTQPHRREYSTYWRSHPIDIRIGRDDIKYKYGIFNQSRRSIDYEGEGEIQNRTLDTRTNDQYDIWQNNKSHGIYNLREFAFVKCIYDAVNNENLKDKVMQFQSLLENHKNHTINSITIEFIMQRYQDKKEKRLFLCVLLGYHIKYRRDPYSFTSQMPTHFRSDCLLEALQSVQYDTFTSNIKPIMTPVVVALVRHNATVRKSFEWLKIFQVAQVLDPNYSFVDGFMNVRYDSEHISHLLKEWPKIVGPHLDQLDDRVYNKIAKWLISFCSKMETLNIIWRDCIYHTSSIDREIANEINGCVYKIIAHDNASALYANFNKVLPEFLDMVANLFRERIINLLKSQQGGWDKNSLSALGKLLKDKQLYFERDDFLSAMNCISQSTVFNVLNMFPELLEYWINSKFHNTRSSEVTNICQQWFTRIISMLNYNHSMTLNEGGKFICVIYEHITRLQSLLTDKSNIYKTLIRVADEKIKKCSHNHILFATVQVATLNKSITTQFYNLVIENVLIASDIRSINNNLMEMICLICGQNNKVNLENLDVPNSISENLLCHIMTCLENQTSQINTTEQQLDLIKNANFWRMIFNARGNVTTLHKHSYVTKIRTALSNLAGSIVDKTIDIKTLQAILKYDDRQLSKCLNVANSPNAKKTFQSVIISENSISTVRKECKIYEDRLRCLKAFYSTFCPPEKVVDSDVYTTDLEGKLKILSKVQLKEALSSRYWERHEDFIQKVAEAYKFANSKTFTNMFETQLSQITDEIQVDYVINALIPAVREEYIKIFKQYKDKKWSGIKYSEAFPLWKNVEDVKKELELINEVVYLGRNNHELEISIRNLTAIPKWEERIQKLSAVVEIFHVPVKTEDWLGRSLKILREDVLVLGKVVEFVKYCKDHNQTDNENYWSLIKELSSASDLLEFLQDIAENDIKNLINGADDYSDERLIQADTVSSLIQVKQLVVQLMNKSKKIDEFLKVLLKISQENPSLPNKITVCAGSNMALQNMLRNISNRGEVTKEKIQNAVLRGTYTFEKDDKSDKFNVTLVYQANKSGEIKHIMSDLLDLRGRALLIAKPANISTDLEEENSRNIMNEFVLQVDTAQEILNVGYKLIQMGHFDYRRFKKEIRGTEKRFGTTDMRDLLTKLKEDLHNWKQVVDEAQEEHYYLTFFPARHILAFYDYFTSDVQDDVNTETCRTLIKFVNSKAELPSRKDRSGISRKNTDYSRTLNEIGKKLQTIFGKLLKTSRELKVRGERIIADVVDKGKLCVASCNDQLRVPNIIMSLYTNHG